MTRAHTLRILRALAAAALLASLLIGVPAYLQRARLSALPDIGAPAVRALRLEGRLGEARVVLDALQAREATSAGVRTHHAPSQELVQEAALLSAAEGSWLRALRDAAAGAATGRAATGAGLAGAVTADMLAIGDIRDLIVASLETAHTDEKTPHASAQPDTLLAQLSAAGLVTPPGLDALPAILKWARREGALSDELGASLLAAMRTGSTLDRASLAWDLGTLARSCSVGGFARVLRHAHTASDVATLATFVRTHGAAPLLLDDGTTAHTLTALPPNAARTAGHALAESAFKGGAAPGNSAALLHAHPLAWALRDFGHGIPSGVLAQLAMRLDSVLPLLAGLAGAWCAWEVSGLCARTRAG